MTRFDEGWVDLTLTITPDITKVPVLPCPEFERLNEQSETSLQISEVTIATHVGTHFDAACHAVAGGKSIDQYDIETWFSTAVVCDVDADPLEPIGVDALEHARRELDDNDAVILRTGWGAYIADERYHEHPYLETDLAEWLVDRNLDWVGMDLLTPDMPSDLRPDGFTFPVHTTLLDADVLIGENFTNLESLPAGPVEVAALPTKFAALDGAPARVVARPL